MKRRRTRLLVSWSSRQRESRAESRDRSAECVVFCHAARGAPVVEKAVVDASASASTPVFSLLEPQPRCAWAGH